MLCYLFAWYAPDNYITHTRTHAQVRPIYWRMNGAKGINSLKWQHLVREILLLHGQAYLKMGVYRPISLIELTSI